MLAAVIILGTLCVLLTFAVGGILGYLFKQYVFENTPRYIHPEMFDTEGNLVADDIIAFRFEGGVDEYLNNNEEDE